MTRKNPAAVALGKLGGKKKGKTKARGDAAYYRELQAKSAAKRKAAEAPRREHGG